MKLDALVPDLLAAYRDGLADGHRLLALAALINIGNERTIRTQRLSIDQVRRAKAFRVRQMSKNQGG